MDAQQQPTNHNADHAARIQALLHSLLVVSAELGPEFIHSDHGNTFLTKATFAIAAISGIVGAAAAQH